MGAFAVVFVAGIVLTAVGVAGGGSSSAATPARQRSPNASGAPSESPATTEPTGPTALTGPTGFTGPTGVTVPADGLIMTTTAESNVSNVGCVAHMSFTWEIDPSTGPAGDAVIVLRGPDGSRRYRAPLDRTTVRLTVDAEVPGPHAEWTASLLTIGGVPVIETPLMVSVDDPMC
jgi:hypothetical protein